MNKKENDLATELYNLYDKRRELEFELNELEEGIYQFQLLHPHAKENMKKLEFYEEF